MSLRKKLEKECQNYLKLDDFYIMNTNITRIYKIRYKTYEPFYFYYSNKRNYKTNIEIFKKVIDKYIESLEFINIKNCKYNRKVLCKSEYKKCKLSCFYGVFCEKEVKNNK